MQKMSSDSEDDDLSFTGNRVKKNLNAVIMDSESNLEYMEDINMNIGMLDDTLDESFEKTDSEDYN